MHLETDRSTTRWFVAKGKAGLGNRMLAAVTADLYAALSGRTPVFDWSDFTYSNDGSNVFHTLFERAGSVAALPDCDETSVDPPLWIGRLKQDASEVIEAIDPRDHTAASAWRKYSTDLTRLDQTERVMVFFSYTQHIGLLRRHFTGPWADWRKLSDDAIIARVLRERMTLSPTIRARVDAFRAAHFGSDTIGVHVRYMDRKSSIGDFLKHIDRAVRRRPKSTIFLATDNRAAEATIRGRYHRVVTTPKWFPETGISMHQNPDCPDRLRNAIEALTDMYLLAACNHLIFPGSSTFSRTASLLSPMPHAHVIDIERFNARIRAKRWIKALIQ